MYPPTSSVLCTCLNSLSVLLLMLFMLLLMLLVVVPAAQPKVIGPRHAFALSKGLEAKLRVPGGACSSTRIREQGGAWSWDLSLLVRGEDVDFVDALGGSVNEYEGFRTAFEEEYTTKLSAAAGEGGSAH